MQYNVHYYFYDCKLSHASYIIVWRCVVNQYVHLHIHYMPNHTAVVSRHANIKGTRLIACELDVPKIYVHHAYLPTVPPTCVNPMIDAAIYVTIHLKEVNRLGSKSALCSYNKKRLRKRNLSLSSPFHQAKA